MSEKKKRLIVTRYNPEKDAAPHTQTFEVSYDDDTRVLDALNEIKDQEDGTLTYRSSCQMGVCGSCGMNVNGVPKLTCATFLREYEGDITVEPLANFPIMRDLAVNMSDFMEKLSRVKPWIIRKKEKSLDDGEYRQSPAQLQAYRQFSMCINCMLCYAACPVYGKEKDFVGPAAIALAHRYNEDSRDEGRAERNKFVGSTLGVWECTFVGECSEVCPKHVDPAAAVQREKLSNAVAKLKSFIMPWGNK
ncbi:MAG: succinate dehydrogenase/fumarate reductase iron-sulfur subunit [Myxococcota bacterium]